MKQMGQFIMVFAAVMTVHFPSLSYGKQYFKLKPPAKVKPAPPTSLEKNLKSIIQHLQELEGESNFGRYYKELESGLRPKYREFLMGKLNKLDRSKAWRDYSIPKLELKGHVLNVTLKGAQEIHAEAEFFETGDIAMMVNGQPILRTETENPTLMFSKIIAAVKPVQVRQPASSTFSFLLGLLTSEAHAMGDLIMGVMLGVLLMLILVMANGGSLSGGESSNDSTF